ncbi:MAG: hypothetical protein ACPGYV_03110 [Phycisphaeraceae bacterium]
MTPDDLRQPAPAQPARRRRLQRVKRAARSPRDRGAVLVLTLLGAFLIVGMLAYVFNTGRHAQLQQQTQSAADATVMSGAGYVARSFNTVAMNNVEIARLIAVVQMLDAMPQSIEYTLLDVQATLERVEEQLAGSNCPLRADLIQRLAESVVVTQSGLFGGLQADLSMLIRTQLAPEVDAMLGRDLEEIGDILYEQIRQLEEMHQFFNLGSYDVREMTFYDSEFGKGELWKAMTSLDLISTATMEQLTDLTQVAAVEAGQRNMRGQGGETLSAVAPFDAGYAWQRFTFDDFRNPVVRGRIPNAVDDPVTNRGPFDTVFGWKLLQREATAWEDTGGDSSSTSARPDSRWSGGGGNGGGGRRATEWEIRSYTTVGTWQWLARLLRQRIDTPDVLENSQFATRVTRMGGNKLNYIWPGSVRTWVFLDPEWITSYNEAEQIIEAGTPRVAYTQFIRQEVGQTYRFYPYDNTLLEAIGAQRPYTVGPLSTGQWEIIRPRGGWTTVPGIANKSCDHVWDDGGAWANEGRERAAIVHTDPETLRRAVDRLRRESEYTLYKADRTVLQPGDLSEEAAWIEFPTVGVEVTIFRFVWAGMNVGPEVTIRDPNNFASRDDLAAPIDFDHSQMTWPDENAPGFPGSPLTFLGLAKQPNRAPLWDQLFNTSAFDGHTGIAQASVFNNHSRDLWTQMWHAQLEPVQDYDEWVSLIQQQVGLASGYEGLSVGELQELADYLESLRALAPVMLNH